MIIQLEGTLESYRDRKFEARSSRVQKVLITKAGEVWYQKMLATGLIPNIQQMAIECALDNYRLKITPIVARHIPIRDFKNVVAGFDHMIFDPLVRAGVLLSDTMNCLDWNSVECVSVAKGEDNIWLSINRSSERIVGDHYRKKALQLQREGRK